MVQLNDGNTSGRLDVRSEASKPRDVRVVETTKLPRKPLTHRLHVSGARHRQAEVPVCPHREPLVLVVRQCALGVALHIGEWGQHEAVLHRWSVDERHRVKQRCHSPSVVVALGRGRIHSLIAP